MANVYDDYPKTCFLKKDIAMRWTLQKFLYLVCILLFNVLFLSASLKGYSYEFAVAGIFQNEPRIKEWIEFHKLVGAEHFYLFNNKSTNDYKKILQPYIDTGEVELFEWPYSSKDLNAQNVAYNEILKIARGVARWVAFLDLDEFLFPVQCTDMREFLKNYRNFGAVCANWVMFGTSNVDKIPKKNLLASKPQTLKEV